MKQDQMMIDAQARIISRQRSDLERLQREISELEAKFEVADHNARFYRDIQTKLMEHPVLRPLWEDFIATMKLLDIQFSDDSQKTNEDLE